MATTPTFTGRAQKSETCLNEIAFGSRGATFSIPTFDYQSITYVGSTNNVSTQVFKRGGSSGTTVATLTYTYVASGVADNDKIASIARS